MTKFDIIFQLLFSIHYSDNGLIFQSVAMRLPVRKYLEERGWVEKGEKETKNKTNEQFADRKCLKIEKRFKVSQSIK